uniref:WH2 domain-containing protein n=1 Tax=Biomphalaria glabrata TaxID=6526 RepID=A0A2C9LTT3_BIOGL
MSTTPAKTAPTELLAEINKSGSTNLHHVNPQEKNPLPSAEVIAEEKHHQEHIENIGKFKRTSLKRTESMEKGCLPSQDGMLRQDQTQLACFHFVLILSIHCFDLWISI